MLPAARALERLRAGNHRFATDDRRAQTSATRRKDLLSGQQPFAIVLGCSDSRVPTELVFDQGLGDLFVIRVAGNVVAPSQIGSVEFAAEQFGSRLVVVLGHSKCGAVTATLQELQRSGRNLSPGLRAIVDRIRPAVQPLLGSEINDHPDSLAQRAVRANIRASAQHLRQGSESLQRLTVADGLRVVGAEYCLETGRVDFFDGLEDLEAPTPPAAE